jgi:hypothetical protein
LSWGGWAWGSSEEAPDVCPRWRFLVLGIIKTWPPVPVGIGCGKVLRMR